MVQTRKENTDDGNGCWRADMISVMRTGEVDGHAPTTREGTLEAHTHPRNDRYAPTDAGILLRVLLFVCSIITHRHLSSAPMAPQQ
jgi:hypothetical protein